MAAKNCRDTPAPQFPPYTTALSMSIRVNVWPHNGGGPSPVQVGLLHSAGGEDNNDKHFMGDSNFNRVHRLMMSHTDVQPRV